MAAGVVNMPTLPGDALRIVRRAVPLFYGTGAALSLILVVVWVLSFWVTDSKFSHEFRRVSGHRATFSGVTFRTYRGLLDIQLHTAKRQYPNTSEFDAYIAHADQADRAEVPFGSPEVNFCFAGLSYARWSHWVGVIDSKFGPGRGIAHTMHCAVVPYWMICGPMFLLTMVLRRASRSRRRSQGTGFPVRQ
jgi:hypothetical protein